MNNDISNCLDNNLDLHGMHPDIALTRLDDFLYRAETSMFKSVKIIHGRGAGRLREMVHSFLDSHILVESYADSDIPGEFLAVTVVKIRFVNV